MPAASPRDILRRTPWPTAVCLVLLGVLAWPILRGLFAIFASNGNYSHGFLLPFVSGYAAWQIGREDHVAKAEAHGLWAGLGIAAAGLLMTLFSYWYAEGLNPGGTGWLFLGSLGLIGVLAGLVAATWGWAWLKRMRFPIGFLCFALPLPGSVLASITLRLQMLGSIGTAALLRLTGNEITRDGNVIQTAGGPVGIIDACSGIRSLWVLLAVAVAILHFGRFTWKRGLAVLAFVPFLAVAGNLVRLYVSALFIMHGRHDFALGSAHELLGLVTFMLALVGLFAVTGWLAPPIPKGETGPAEPVAADHEPRELSRVPVVVVLGLVVMGMGFRLLVTAHYAVTAETEYLEGAERKSFAAFPQQLGDFRLVRRSTFSDEELAELRPSDHMVGAYMNQRGQIVEAQLSYWQPQSLVSMGAFRHPHWPDTCYPSQGWTRIPALDAEKTYAWLPNERPRVRAFRKALDDEKSAVVVLAAWRSRADPRRLFVPSAWGERVRALLESWQGKRRLVRSQYGITLRVFLGATIHDPTEAMQAIEQFGEALAPQLPAFGLSREHVERDRAATTDSGDTAP